jgi:hypothetical protein
VSARRRRDPSFTAFLVTGALLGFAAGAAASLRGGAAGGYTEGSALAYLGVVGAGLGALLAGVVAVLLDRRR